MIMKVSSELRLRYRAVSKVQGMEIVEVTSVECFL